MTSPIQSPRPSPLHHTDHPVLPPTWIERIELLDFAFQPIVNIHSGSCFGVEALLRGVERLGFSSIQAFFDAAHADGVLVAVSLALRARAVAKFARSRLAGLARLFFNLDNRELDDPDYDSDATAAVMARHGLQNSSLCLEVSERHQFGTLRGPVESLRSHRQRDHKIAIDDFGTGFSGLQLLYSAEPDFIKIDRFFVADIATDPRKRLFVASIVGIAHLMGILVIAEGVESLREYYTCRAVGCDLVQGFFVQVPIRDEQALEATYESVAEASRQDRRRELTDQRLIVQRMQLVPAIDVETDMSEVLGLFRRDRAHTFFPVVDVRGEPLGILRESDLREYAYSALGKDLLCNPSLRRTLRHFVVPCPITDIKMKAEKILELFSLDEESDGILVVEDQRYVGFLNARSLLQIINEKNLLVARDQNPLTRLPGNTVIYEYVSGLLGGSDCAHVVAYLDFDHFKPLNDTYGFRTGDRAILLFAELLQKHVWRDDRFVGHIGGDDFFVGLRGATLLQACTELGEPVRRFEQDVQSLYDPTARACGFIEALDRQGRLQRYPLLTVSVAALEIPSGSVRTPMDGIIAAITQLKHAAKESPSRLAAAVLRPDGTLARLTVDESLPDQPCQAPGTCLLTPWEGGPASDPPASATAPEGC